VIWYELDEDHRDLPAEGMMFVGDKGKIPAGFRVENPRFIPERNMGARGYPPPGTAGAPAATTGAWPGTRYQAMDRGLRFLNAGPISDAVNLYGASSRGRQRLLFDGEMRKITNSAGANKSSEMDALKASYPYLHDLA